MPELPSGLNLALSRYSLFDHGGNWFDCPDGNFWYWAPHPDMGPPPYDPNIEVGTIARHSPVPTSREEAKRFIWVHELTDNGMYGWRGEWLSLFPRYTELDERDLAAWNAWLDLPTRNQYLDDTITECLRLAEISRHAQGYALVEGVGEPDEDGSIKGNLRIPAKGH